MDFRSTVLKLGLKQISQQLGEQPMCILEIGCMFKKNEGKSTLILGEFVHNRPGGGRLISIEYDQNHIDSCKEILRKHAPQLINNIEFHCGHSLAVLPPLLEDLKAIHLVIQDGGAHPEVCLQEFELLANSLAPEGLILVDDAQKLEFSEAYSLPRPLGKCTFILPYLLLANYKTYRKEYRNANATVDGPDSIPDSKFIRQIMNVELPKIEPRDFILLEARHKMLAYGNVSLLQEWQAKSNTIRSKVARIKSCIMDFLEKKL